VFTIASGAIILIPTLLWSIGLIKEIDPQLYRMVWWALGHSSQQINVAAHVSIWYLVAAVAFGAKPMSKSVSRFAFLLYILFLQLASAHHLLSDPGLSAEWKVFNTSYFMYFAVLASMIHGLTVPGAIEAAQRQKGYTKGLFEWLRKAPWGNPVFSGMFISLVGFGFLGGISGVMMGTEQLNMLIHNTIYVPGHFHATVVSAPRWPSCRSPTAGADRCSARDAVPQAVPDPALPLRLLSMSCCLVMMGAGTLGVSRRHWDMAFSGAPFQYEWPGAAYLMMGLTGIFGVIAVIGGGLWIFLVVWSLLFGKKLDGGPTPTSRRRFPTSPRRGSRLRAPAARTMWRAGHGGAGHVPAGLLRPLLLRELEVPVRSLGPQLIRN
jgi:cytochrome c oxidase subunit 1